MAALLNRREHYTLPVLLARVIGNDSKPHDTGLLSRRVVLEQPTEPPVWLVYQVKLNKSRDKCLAEIGEGVRDEYGEFLGYRRQSDWTNSIMVNPPAGHIEFLLHPNASASLCFSVGLVLRGKPSTKRRAVVRAEYGNWAW